MLILDEPTNHLDLEMRHALAMALQGYTGAIVLVSHDRHLLRHVVESLWLVEGGAVTEYPDDLPTYEKWVLAGDKTSKQTGAGEAKSATPKPGATNKAAPSSTSAGDLAREKGVKGKEGRQSGAEQRVRLKPLRQALQKTEKQLERLQTELAKLQEALADPALYEADQRDRLAAIVKDEGALKAEVEGVEEQWMEQQQALEDAS